MKIIPADLTFALENELAIIKIIPRKINIIPYTDKLFVNAIILKLFKNI